MLSYRHLFHAGNHADVLKHALLVRLLLALHKKDTAFRVLETHGGAGRYDLSHPWAQKNREFEAGIARLWGRTDVPALLAPYLEAVRRENPRGALQVYPGSPVIARGLLRAQDRLVVTDLHPAEAESLERLFAGDAQVKVERRDAYEALRAHLPPPQRRGLVHVDPAFERKDELARLVAGLKDAHRRWATGVYALWYPLLDSGTMAGFERGLADTGIRKVLQVELEVGAGPRADVARGSGLVVVNPPWRFDDEARAITEWLARVLAQGPGSAAQVRWLVPE